jgi:predicted enzyme related to lactoylglutathione lyase
VIAEDVSPHQGCYGETLVQTPDLDRMTEDGMKAADRHWATAPVPPRLRGMEVERMKTIIWAKDMARAVQFYQTVFGAAVNRQNEVLAELQIAGGLLGIHSGGEAERTWTGLAFQVNDLFGGCDLVKAHGGKVDREPEDTPDEPAHLAMCVDPEGNEFMLTRARHR